MRPAGPALSVTVVVEDKPGAAGALGASYVAKAAPDGRTLCRSCRPASSSCCRDDGKRIALAPDLWTLAEAGVPGFEMSSWQAVYAPKGTPQPVVQRLHAEIAKILKAPEVTAKLSGQLGMEIVAGSPAELAALMQKEIPRWAELVRKSGATPS